MNNPLTILGTGSYVLPIVSNDELLSYLEAPHNGAWLEEKTGIQGHSLNFDCSRGRKISTEDGLDYALHAALDAINAADILPTDIDQVVYATCTPKHVHFMADTIEIHRVLGFLSTTVVDQVDGGCAALAKAFQLVQSYATNHPGWKALIIGSNDVSSMIDKERYKHVPHAWTSPAIFGDGAAAIVLGPGENKPWLRKVYCAVDGDHPLVSFDGGGTAKPTSISTLGDHTYLMDARDVARQFVPTMSRVLKNLCSHISSKNVGRWYVHQANLRLIERFAIEHGIDMGNIPHNVDTLGNTVSASTLLLLHEDLARGYQPTKPIVFAYVGAGMMEGGAVFMPG